MIRRFFLTVALWACPVLAGPPLTTIQDVLYKADGTRFNGAVTISWSTFTAPDSSTVLTQSTTVWVVDGNLRVKLIPNTSSTLATTYVVTYNSEGRYQFQENWIVPVSAQALHVSDVRVVVGAGGLSTGADADSSGPFAESAVTGLAADLGARPLKGPGFLAGRTAVIDSNGMIEAAAGSAADCVRVDGSAGPCGGGSSVGAVSFVDGESPTGIVDGSNTAFGLSGAPDPASSLAFYRNGILQKTGQDYSLAGSTIQLVAAARPQPGDTLLANYRLGGSGSAADTLGYSGPQVLCSGAGAAAGATVLSVLGSCAIPAGLLAPGDRVEIRFNYAHTGSGGGFSSEVHWGGSLVLHRDLGAAETLLMGSADAAIVPAGAQIGLQNWGSSAPLAVSAQTAAGAYANGVTVLFLGAVSNGSDTVALSNFSMVRIP